jgi:putative ABC transport system permease protein
MRPAWRLIARRQLRAHPGRTLLAVAGIALGVALVLAIQLINRSTLVALRQTVEDTAGRAQLQVLATSDAGFPEEVVEHVRGLPGVTLAVPLVEGSALVDDGRGESVTIFGVDLGDEASVRTYRGVTEEADAVIDDPLVFLSQADSVVVTRAFAAARGLGLDGRFPVVAPTGRRRLAIRGLLEATGVARVYGTGLAIMDIMGAQRLLDREGRVDRIDVVLAPEVDVESVIGALARALPPGLSVERPARRGEQVEGMLAGFQAMLSSMSTIALLVGVFIVYNRLATVVVERRVEIGILRALGARRRDVVRLHLAEALGAGALGVVGGVGLGIGLAHVLLETVTRSAASALSLPPLPARLAPTPDVVALAAVAGAVATLVAAVVPALDAARMPPIEALRRLPPPPRTSRGARALGLGVTLVAVAGACLGASVRFRSPPFAYVAGLALLAGVALLCVPAVLVAAPLVRRLGARFFGPTGRLAGDLGRRLPLRTAATVAALSLGLSMSAGITILARSFERSMQEWVRSWTDQDLYVRSAAKERGLIPAPMSERLAFDLGALPGVGSVETFRMIRQRYGGDTIMLTALSKADLPGKHARVSEVFARRHRVGPGDRLRLETPRGPRRFQVVGVERSYNSDRGSVSIGAETFRRLWGDRLLTDIGVLLLPGTERVAMRLEILRRFGQAYHLEVLEPKALEARLLADIARAFSFTWGLEAVTMLVAGLGVFDTVLAGVLARRREIGVLRAIGCLRRQVAEVFGLEGLLIGILGAVLGLLTGFVIALTWITVVFPETIGFIVDLYMPAVRLAAVALAALVLAAAAAVVPARRAAGLTVTEAIACE